MSPPTLLPPLLTTLPVELILQIGYELLHPLQTRNQDVPPHGLPQLYAPEAGEAICPNRKDLPSVNSLARSSRYLYNVLNSLLWSLMDLNTTLIWAASESRWDLVRYTLSHGANPDIDDPTKYDKYGYAPRSLDYASDACNVSIMKELLDAGADIRPHCTTQFKSRPTPMEIVLRSWEQKSDQPGRNYFGAFKLLLDRGANVGWGICATRGYDNPEKKTPLKTREAVRRVIQILIKEGDPTATLLWAVESSKWDIAATAISRGAWAWATPPHGIHFDGLALNYAARGGHLPTLVALLNAGFLNASRNHRAEVRKSLRWAVDGVMQMGKMGQTPRPEQDYFGVVRLLLQRGAAVGWDWKAYLISTYPRTEKGWNDEMMRVAGLAIGWK